MSFDLNTLNKQQQLAVFSNSKYIRVIAGAGSGKTRVLVTRIMYLVKEKGVNPKNILAITFTNKAAKEMKERILKDLHDESTMTISTIHSLCVRILRQEINAFDYPSNFTIIDHADQISILKDAYRECSLEIGQVSHASMLDYISNNKMADVSVSEAYQFASGDIEKKKVEVYQYYLERLKKNYALDFDDLILVTIRLFRHYPEILAKWNRRYRYIHVDEFQDIDEQQYSLIKLLVGNDNSIYVVGDPDQTIYSWRGADVNIIMGFEKEFDEVETIILNQNYRSTHTILNGSNSLIKHNRNRVEKDLFTEALVGDKITHYSCANDLFEATYIANEILSNNKHSYSDFAILYRSNYQSRALEKALKDFKIPYVIYGGIRFFDRQEVKDALSYLRMIVHADDFAFARIINTPKRGFGDKSFDLVKAKANALNLTYFETIQKEKLFSGKVLKQVEDFITMILNWRKIYQDKRPSEMLEIVLDQSGYRMMLEKDKETDRIENLKELINDIESYEKTALEPSLDEYLQEIALYTDIDDGKYPSFVSLMTVHASKGLEFHTVFVYGMNDGVFPSQRSMFEGIKGLEEERRLAYVAFTRACKKLYITESGGYNFQMQKEKEPSRFISEIDEEFIHHVGVSNQKASIFIDTTLNKEKSVTQRPMLHKIERNVQYRKKDIVVHEMFGKGIVLNQVDDILEIAFDHPIGIKKINCRHPKLSKKVN